jgi:hypothetical protein
MRLTRSGGDARKKGVYCGAAAPLWSADTAKNCNSKGTVVVDGDLSCSRMCQKFLTSASAGAALFSAIYCLQLMFSLIRHGLPAAHATLAVVGWSS